MFMHNYTYSCAGSIFAPVAQLAEAAALKPVRCQSESDRGYHGAWFIRNGRLTSFKMSDPWGFKSLRADHFFVDVCGQQDYKYRVL